MGGGSKKVVSKTNKVGTTNTTVAPESWVSDASKEAYKAYQPAALNAGGALTADEKAAGKSFTADLTPEMWTGINNIMGHAYDYQPYLKQASEILDPAKFGAEYNFGTGFSRGVDPSTGKNYINFEDFTPSSVGRYMNPYRDFVIDTGMDKLDRERQIAQRDLGANAGTAAGLAGWGTRHGVAEAETNRGAFDVQQQFLANALDAAYQQAVAQRNAEREAGMKGIDMENANMITGANAYSELGKLYQDLGLKGGAAQLGAGMVPFQQQQSALDTALALRGANLDARSSLADFLQKVPHATTTNAKETTKGKSVEPQASSNTAGQIAGSAISAGIPLITSLLSDPKAKEDKQEIDPAKETALGAFRNVPVSSYKYKPEIAQALGLPTDQRIGPMADDYAGAFGGDGMTIDLPNLIGYLTQAIKELDLRTAKVQAKQRGISANG